MTTTVAFRFQLYLSAATIMFMNNFSFWWLCSINVIVWASLNVLSSRCMPDSVHSSFRSSALIADNLSVSTCFETPAGWLKIFRTAFATALSVRYIVEPELQRGIQKKHSGLSGCVWSRSKLAFLQKSWYPWCFRIHHVDLEFDLRIYKIACCCKAGCSWLSESSLKSFKLWVLDQECFRLILKLSTLYSVQAVHAWRFHAMSWLCPPSCCLGARIIG